MLKTVKWHFLKKKMAACAYCSVIFLLPFRCLSQNSETREQSDWSEKSPWLKQSDILWQQKQIDVTYTCSIFSCRF